jgi:hypothetical protein
VKTLAARGLVAHIDSPAAQGLVYCHWKSPLDARGRGLSPFAQGTACPGRGLLPCVQFA